MDTEKHPFDPGLFHGSGGTWNAAATDGEAPTVAHKILGTWNSYESGFRVILLCFFVFTLSVTVALVVQILYGKSEVSVDGAVVSDERICTDIGKSTLVRGGSAVDAVVAAAFCLALKRPQSGGLGGGGFLLIHKHGHNGVSEILNFRETASLNDVSAERLSGASRDVGSQGLLVAVPGIVAGLEAAHSKYGLLPWEDVVSPTVRLFGMEKVPFSRPQGVGGISFALQEVLDGGANAFYNGTIAKRIVSAVKKHGGVLTEQDLSSYSAKWEKPIRFEIAEDVEVMAPDFPSAGPALLHALGILRHKEMRPGTISEIGARKLMMDALKLSLGRFFHHGDPTFSGNTSDPDSAMMEGGTISADAAIIGDDLSAPLRLPRVLPPFSNSYGVHVAAVDSRDLYASYVSELGVPGLNPIPVPEAGFDLNFAMLDFDLSPTIASGGTGEDSKLKNRPGVGKRPLSLGVPAMIVPRTRLCRARVISGSSNVGSVLQVLARKVFLADLTKDAVEKFRWYLGDSVGSSGYMKEIKDVVSPGQILNGPYPSVNLIVKVNDSISAFADSRSRTG